MGKDAFDKISVESLKGINVLFSGDIYHLAMFLLKTYDAKDAGTLSRSRPTLHGLAKHYANIANMNIDDILQVLWDHGMPKAATVEFEKDIP